MGVEIREDLTVAIGRAAVKLTPSEGFRLAETIIRRSVTRMLEEEITGVDASRAAAAKKGRNV